jgi:hypothetical protein
MLFITHKEIWGVSENSIGSRATSFARDMRFDVALLKRIDAAAKNQGISRTAWIHVAASKALE